MPLVELEHVDNVRVITLNDPTHSNLLDWPTLQELRAAVDAVTEDNRARAVVFRAAGSMFSAGAAYESVFGDPSRPTEEIRDQLMRVFAAFTAVEALLIPTIVAIQGSVVGLALNLVASCDVIVASKSAQFAPDFTATGLHPGGGLSWLLTQRVGSGRAAALLYSGESVDAEEALRIGLVQELADSADERALELAAHYATRNPRLLRALKRSLTVAVRSDLRANIEVESLALAESITSVEYHAFLQTRAATN